MDAHICNYIIIGFEVDGLKITLYENWKKEKLSIDYFCIWGCKCYVYSDLKLLLADICQDKFINYKKIGIFLKYNNRIDY